MSSIPLGLKRTAAMVVLRHERHFLLMKRNRPPHVGKYVPVGGKLDPFEDPYSAALRETFEETGWKVDKLTYAGVLVETSPIDYNWQCHIYLADVPPLPPPPCDEGDLSWIAFDDIPTIPTPPTDWILYQYLMRRQPFAFNAIYDADLTLTDMWEEIEGVRVWGGGD